MSKFNEITAVKACGISLYRLIIPLVILGVVFSGVSFYLQEHILPAASKKQEQLWNKINDLPPRTYSQINQRWLMSRSGKKMYYYRYFEPLQATFSQLMIFESLRRQWSARKAIWKENKLVLSQGWVREFNQNQIISFREFEKGEISPVEDKSYFIKEKKIPEQMTFKELKNYIREVQARGFESRPFKCYYCDDLLGSNWNFSRLGVHRLSFALFGCLGATPFIWNVSLLFDFFSTKLKRARGKSLHFIFTQIFGFETFEPLF